MPDPKGTLTGPQYEIMSLIWEAGDAGMGVTEIWQTISSRRDVTRTTVLNLVDRLEKRLWLRRAAEGNSFRYTAAVTREWAESRLASGFIGEFFGGSATQMVQSLLGARELSANDIDQLRVLLEKARKARGGKGGKS